MYVQTNSPQQLGGIFSKIGKVLKKSVKLAATLSPSHQILKRVAPKAMLLSPSQMLLSKLDGAKKTSAPKTPPNATQVPADVAVIPSASPSQPLDFGTAYGGGGGGGIPLPTQAEEPAAVAETNYLPWILGGVAVLGAGYFLLKKKR